MAYKIFRKINNKRYRANRSLKHKKYRFSRYSENLFLSKMFGDKPKRKNNVGKVYRGRTKYIDPENKLERNYVVLKDGKKGVTIAKLKSIKKFDEHGHNADKALQEINSKRYGLLNRTGVDFQKFSMNRMTHKGLLLQDKEVFPEGKERFSLGSHDLSRVLKHTKIKK